MATQSNLELQEQPDLIKPLPPVPSKHHKSVFSDEHELLQALIDIHLHGDIELDPMYFKGNFYKNGINKPKYRYDLNLQVEGVQQADATDLPFPNNSIERMILDPPFIFGTHGKEGAHQKNYYSSRTHTIFKNWQELETLYKGILAEAYRVLKPKGKLIFKCQDYTDSKTTMTHVFVYHWAKELGFYPKDLALLVKPNKIYNGNTTQRHLRKVHTYFWVFERQTGRNDLLGTSPTIDTLKPSDAPSNPNTTGDK